MIYCLDKRWYKYFLKYGSFQTYEYLDGNKIYRENQKKLFLKGQNNNPTLDYPLIDFKELKVRKIALTKLKENIVAKEKNSQVKQIYSAKIEEKLDQIQLLNVAVVSNGRTFQKYSEKLYGRPLKKIYDCAQEFLYSKLLPISAKTIIVVKKHTLNEFAILLKQIPPSKKAFDMQDIVCIFKQSLKALNILNWQVRINRTSKNQFVVNQEDLAIKIPFGRRANRQELTAVLVHELGTHLLRRINGEKQRLQLLGIGLDKYDKGEEGIAAIREQVLTKKFNLKMAEYYYAISLVYGLDGDTKDFRNLFAIMKQYYLCKNECLGDDFDKSNAKANNQAWELCVRVFRGTDCKSKGICFTKDLIYLEGYLSVCKIINEHPGEIKRFNIGTYDPSNPRHIILLDKLGIK